MTARGVNKKSSTTAPVYKPIFFSREVTADVRIPEGKTLVLVDEGEASGSGKGEAWVVFIAVTTKPLTPRF